ncbi:TPA: GNAT family N-acetyltransferase [Patescibacteria group bacterium]|nr:GNAT family N-acetyltransferase [Candidatus Gracilibacteria bacterium]
MKSANIKIQNLCDYPEHIQTVAKRYRKVFFKDSVDNMYNTIYCIQHACQKNKIPQTLIVFYDEIPVGTAAIWNCDIAYRQDLSPRLANVFVLPEYRHLGIGTMLQKEVFKRAKKLGYKKIYLYSKLE